MKIDQKYQYCKKQPNDLTKHSDGCVRRLLVCSPEYTGCWWRVGRFADRTSFFRFLARDPVPFLCSLLGQLLKHLKVWRVLQQAVTVVRQSRLQKSWNFSSTNVLNRVDKRSTAESACSWGNRPTELSRHGVAELRQAMNEASEARTLADMECSSPKVFVL